jgi:hypothetical protein
MIKAISLFMTLSAIINACITAEQKAAGQTGATKLPIATATATAAINALVPGVISTATAGWLQTVLGDAINGVVAVFNLIGVFKHSTSPAS